MAAVVVTLPMLRRRVETLEEDVAELKRRIEAIADRPDPNRPIGPRPGRPPWGMSEPDDKVVWPPLIRRLSK